MGDIDPAAFIVALSGLLTVTWGIRQSRSGQRNERDQQKVANELQTKAQNHDVYRDMVADLERQADRANAVAAAKDEEIAEMRAERASERRDQVSELAHLRDIIATLRDVVHSEIATTLADDGINASEHHDPREED